MCTGDIVTYTACCHVEHFCYQCLVSSCNSSTSYITVHTMCGSCTEKLGVQIFFRWALARARLGKRTDLCSTLRVPIDKVSERFDAVDARLWEERRAAGLTGPMFLNNEEVEIFHKGFADNVSVSAWMITPRSSARVVELMNLLQACTWSY